MTPEDKDTRLTVLPNIQNTTFIIVETLKERTFYETMTYKLNIIMLSKNKIKTIRYHWQRNNCYKNIILS